MRIVAIALALLCVPAFADIVGVSGPNSSLGAPPAVITAPPSALDDIVDNKGMQGFNEALGVTTTIAHAYDMGFIPVGTLVDSHMIFLNSAGSTALTHVRVDWVFDGVILGVMSDTGGFFEAASTFELGNPGTNYTVTGPGTGPAAPFPARGMEGGDSYFLINPHTLRVNMAVIEPGDWIRVVTTAPEPSSLALLGAGAAIVAIRRKRKRA